MSAAIDAQATLDAATEHDVRSSDSAVSGDRWSPICVFRAFAVRDFWFEAPTTLVSHTVPVIDGVAYEFEAEGVTVSTDDVQLSNATRTQGRIVLGDREARLETIRNTDGGAYILRWANRSRSVVSGGRRIAYVDTSPTLLCARWTTEAQRAVALRIIESVRFTAPPADAIEPPEQPAPNAERDRR
ncbi:MAG: hypothetical protein JNK05_03080 [Myxococcales bacterium]|nr:hypothetical protein [Myxococcales bacterium]